MGLGVFVMLAGCVVLSAGMSIVIESNSGTGPNDLIAFGWADGSVLLPKSLKVIKKLIGSIENT